MTSKKLFSLNAFLVALIDKLSQCDKKEYAQYIDETIEKCDKLCDNGEEIRALTEIKYLLINLSKALI